MAIFTKIISISLLALTASAAVIPNSWIVFLNEGSDLEAHLTWLATQDNTGYAGVQYEWETLVGYSGEFAPKVISAVKARPEVSSVSANNIITLPVEPTDPGATSKLKLMKKSGKIQV